MRINWGWVLSESVLVVRDFIDRGVVPLGNAELRLRTQVVRRNDRSC